MDIIRPARSRAVKPAIAAPALADIAPSTALAAPLSASAVGSPGIMICPPQITKVNTPVDFDVPHAESGNGFKPSLSSGQLENNVGRGEKSCVMNIVPTAPIVERIRPDALSAMAIAAQHDAPLVLSTPTGLPNFAYNILNGFKAADVVVIGERRARAAREGQLDRADGRGESAPDRARGDQRHGVRKRGHRLRSPGCRHQVGDHSSDPHRR